MSSDVEIIWDILYPLLRACIIFIMQSLLLPLNQFLLSSLLQSYLTILFQCSTLYLYCTILSHGCNVNVPIHINSLNKRGDHSQKDKNAQNNIKVLESDINLQSLTTTTTPATTCLSDTSHPHFRCVFHSDLHNTGKVCLLHVACGCGS